MIFKIIVFIGLYFLIKNMLKSAFAPTGPSVDQTVKKSPDGDIIEAEFREIKK